MLIINSNYILHRWLSAYIGARDALAKQPDTRALDKALLEAEIKVLTNFDECEHKPTWNTVIDMISERKAKLARLNKE